MAVENLHSVFERTERWGEPRGWVGPDPYEGLNSPLGQRVPTKLGRQLVTQLYKRSPVPPPWPLRAHPRANAKTLALALSGYATRAGRALPASGQYLDDLPRRLERLAIDRGGAAWGYPFPVQTRNIRYPPTSPNAVATCFVVEALLDAHAASGDPRPLALALSARPFLLSLRSEAEQGPFFAYVATGSGLIHNASMLVCGALARLHGHDPDDAAAEAAREAAATTLACQRPDGLWPYGEAPNFGWVDNFHTAYTLEALLGVRSAFGLGSAALAAGCRAWLDAFVEPGGWTPYFLGRRHPLETHSCAAAIDLLCREELAPMVPDRLEVANRVAACAVRELWLPGPGRFAFRLGPRRLNERAFVRWTNAPMFRALGRLLGEPAAG